MPVRRSEEDGAPVFEAAKRASDDWRPDVFFATTGGLLVERFDFAVAEAIWPADFDGGDAFVLAAGFVFA